MSYNPYEDVSIDNPLPCKEVDGTYTHGEDVSEANPFPVMVVDADAYTKFEDVSEDNPQPIALDTGDTYTRFEDLSDTNRKPVVIVEGQSFDPKQPVSMTNPWPVIDTTAALSYTGPLDLVPGAVVAYSIRALSVTQLEQPLFTLVNNAFGGSSQIFSSGADGNPPSDATINAFITVQQTGAVTDSSDMITLVDATGVLNGQLVTGANIAADTHVLDNSNAPIIQLDQPATGDNPSELLTFTGTPLGILWNDQSGNARDVEDSGGELYSMNVQNGKPAMQGARWEWFGDSFALPGGAYTIFLVTRGSGMYWFDTDGGKIDCYASISGNPYIDVLNGDTSNEAGGQLSASLSDTVAIQEIQVQYGSRSWKENGVDQTFAFDYDSGGAIGTLNINDISFQTATNPAQVCEALFYGSILSPTDCTAIRQNIAGYYGITLG